MNRERHEAPVLPPPGRKSAYGRDELIACALGELFDPDSGRLPLPDMLMTDRVTRITAEGGRYGRGEIVAEMDVHPDLWFFKCHFKGDPVMPGCLRRHAPSSLEGFFLGWFCYACRGPGTGTGDVEAS